jgi:hypothetical protein
MMATPKYEADGDCTEGDECVGSLGDVEWYLLDDTGW